MEHVRTVTVMCTYANLLFMQLVINTGLTHLRTFSYIKSTDAVI
jgi:hypothetical protein